jgi:hypothetical protein
LNHEWWIEYLSAPCCIVWSIDWIGLDWIGLPRLSYIIIYGIVLYGLVLSRNSNRNPSFLHPRFSFTLDHSHHYIFYGA